MSVAGTGAVPTPTVERGGRPNRFSSTDRRPYFRFPASARAHLPMHEDRLQRPFHRPALSTKRVHPDFASRPSLALWTCEPWRLVPGDTKGYAVRMGQPPATRDLLIEWEARCRVNIDTHAWSERFLDRLNTACAVISIGSMVLLGVVASSFDLTEGIAKSLVISLSVVAALVSVIGTVRNYGLLAASHRNAARQYGALRREIELLWLMESADPEAFSARLRELQRRWDWIADIAPNAPQRIRDKASRQGRTEVPSRGSQNTETRPGLTDSNVQLIRQEDIRAHD
jgi:hypothetical protein